MANRLNWSLGHEGKGNWYKNGDISTWNVDSEQNPHHHEVATREMNDPDVKAHEPGAFFYVSPNGALHDGGIGFNNQTPHSDDQIVKQITDSHPSIYDGRGEQDFSHIDEAEPRVEMPDGGYGHAYNLLNLMSKLGAAGGEGWADFHTELKIPRGVRAKIRRWVDRLKWPEESEKADARTYHITILSMDEYDETFAKWASQQMRGKVFTFKTSKMDIFADEHVVLRLDCPEWTELVEEWESVADDRKLKPRKFSPPKAHITIGKSPSGKWPQGIPDPHLKFDTRQFNINKNAAAGDPWQPGAWGKGMYVNGEPTLWETTSPYEGAMMPIHGDYSTSHDGRWPSKRDAPIVVSPQGTYSQGPDYDWSKIERGSTDPLLQREFDETKRNLDSFQETHGLTRVSPQQWKEEMRTQAVPSSGFGHAKNIMDILDKQSAIQWASGDGTCDHCGETQIGKDAEDGVAICSNCGGHITVLGEPKTAAQPTVADELKQWLDSFSPEGMGGGPPSIHHTDAEQMQPQVAAPMSVGPHVDPPSKPYEPYNWADEGWQESPLNRTAVVGWKPQIEPQFKRMYHTSPAENRESIEREGLRPRWDSDVDDEPGVFMTGDVPRNNNPNIDVYEVNTDGLNVKQDPWGLGEQVVTPGIDKHDELYGNEGGAWYSPDHISPERITRMAAMPDTHVCSQCGSSIDSPICGVCGYDPGHADGEYEKSKNNWYDRAWNDPDQQPRPIPNQPMHWGDQGHATDVKQAKSGSDQQDNEYTVGSVSEETQPPSHSRSTDGSQASISILTTSIDNSTSGWREI